MLFKIYKSVEIKDILNEKKIRNTNKILPSFFKQP